MPLANPLAPPTGGPLRPTSSPMAPTGPGPWAQGYLTEPGYAFGNAMGLANAQFAPQQAAFAGIGQSILGQILGAQSNYSYQSGLATQGNALQQQSLGLQGQGNALQQQLLGIDQAGVNAGYGFLDRREGLADSALVNQLRSLGLDARGARQAAATDLRQIGNRAEAGGSWFSPERRLASEDVNDSLANQLAQIRLQRQGAELGREGQQIGFDEDRFGLGQQTQQNQVQGDQIGLAAQQLGIDSQQLGLALQQTLTNLGIQNAEQILGLNNAYGENAGQSAGLQAQAIQLALQLTLGPGYDQLAAPRPPGGRPGSTVSQTRPPL